MSKQYVDLVKKIITEAAEKNVVRTMQRGNDVVFDTDISTLVVTTKNNSIIKVKLNLKQPIDNIIDSDKLIDDTKAPMTHRGGLESPDEYASLKDDPKFEESLVEVEQVFKKVGTTAAFILLQILINTEYLYNNKELERLQSNNIDDNGRWLRKFGWSYNDGVVFPDGMFQIGQRDMEQIKSDLGDAFELDSGFLDTMEIIIGHKITRNWDDVNDENIDQY